MKINVEIDLSDSWEGDAVKEVINNLIKDSVTAQLKRDKRYKDYIQQKIEESLDGLIK